MLHINHVLTLLGCYSAGLMFLGHWMLTVPRPVLSRPVPAPAVLGLHRGQVATRLGQTALFKAVLFGHMNTTERLVEAGAQSEACPTSSDGFMSSVLDHRRDGRGGVARHRERGR